MNPAKHSNEAVQAFLDQHGTTKGLLAPHLDVTPQTLAHLNFGIYRQLRKLGASKERICSVLRLCPTEYDYIEQLG